MRHVKLAGFLTILCLVGMLAAIPYLAAVLGGTPAAAKLPLPVGITVTIIQQLIMAFILGWLGFIMGEKLGLDAPIFRRWVTGTGNAQFQKKDVWQALISGFVGTLVVIILEMFVFQPLLPEISSKSHPVPHWAGILTFLQGGVFEEVLVRLFFMTLIVWILYKLFGKTSGRKVWMYWTGIIAAAILFGVSHLPAAQQIFGFITPILFIRTIVSNGLLGIVFGYLYWKKGLEYAMISHAIGDIILHGILG
ncbi:CPBP family intramembrane glutamic endopeptidase [Neobacillus cucumis]|uniref:CPBP family intramembrane glutamic endopeptidase n=1 Tax=Neobacillus cucumis TaxID=1740721 RepID=UPI001962B34C|nr:CPBP family intramembrane glutamic endopeptidase [Neobacillus cucumis]MBM7652190.1 membrane protease YdiL (CAAX protease family) [Neobacillus cucumis]